MASLYEPQNLKEEATKNMLILDSAMTLQAIVQLLVSKGIIANVEIDYVKEQLKNSPDYKAAYKMYQDMMNAAKLYEQDPQAYLRGILDAKIRGKI